jgi:hypothetical protein
VKEEVMIAILLGVGKEKVVIAILGEKETMVVIQRVA